MTILAALCIIAAIAIVTVVSSVRFLYLLCVPYCVVSLWLRYRSLESAIDPLTRVIALAAMGVFVGGAVARGSAYLHSTGERPSIRYCYGGLYRIPRFWAWGLAWVSTVGVGAFLLFFLGELAAPITNNNLWAVGVFLYALVLAGVWLYTSFHVIHAVVGDWKVKSPIFHDFIQFYSSSPDAEDTSAAEDTSITVGVALALCGVVWLDWTIESEFGPVLAEFTAGVLYLGLWVLIVHSVYLQRTQSASRLTQ